jgi:arylsulfatase A-like enzyme
MNPLERLSAGMAAIALALFAAAPALAQAPVKKPNVVVLMQDDTGFSDFGAYLGGRALGHPTPNVDRLAKEGAMFTSWYGQASCTAGRASFLTGRIPIRVALSVVVVPGDENYLRKETPTMAEFFKRNGYRTYFSGKWHLGDKPEAYPIEHGFDEMKHFAAYYPGVYTYSDTSPSFHPWFPSYNAKFNKEYFDVVNMFEWEGVAGQPAKKVAEINWDYLANFDVRQADSAIEYIKKHANDDKPFFMDVNFMKMHNPNNPAPKFAGKTRLGRYSDAMLELDDNIGRIMDAIRQVAPNTIVITTADNGAWQDAWPDAGTHPYRGEKGSTYEAGWRVPAIMWWPGHIPAGAVYDQMMSHIDAWPTVASMAGITAPPHGEWKDNNGKPIFFDGIDNSAYILGKAKHSARTTWIYIREEAFEAVRVDIGGDPNNADVNIAWKYNFSAKDTWLGPNVPLGNTGALYCLTMDPYEKYDMMFNGAVSTRSTTTSPGRYAGEDNGWALAMFQPVIHEFDVSLMKYPSIKRIPSGADLNPNLKNPENPVPGLDPAKPPRTKAAGG